MNFPSRKVGSICSWDKRLLFSIHLYTFRIYGQNFKEVNLVLMKSCKFVYTSEERGFSFKESNSNNGIISFSSKVNSYSQESDSESF